MKIIRDDFATKNRKRVVSVELEQGEQLVAVNVNRHYRLGQPMDDVVAGHILAAMVVVHWCSIGQKWEA